jgi:hypothetical protein
VCSFSALRGKTAHKMIDKYHAAAGEKRIFEMQNNATAQLLKGQEIRGLRPS